MITGTAPNVTSAGNHLESEEHTSELQSPDHLVCRLLLEKKKKKTHHEQATNSAYTIQSGCPRRVNQQEYNPDPAYRHTRHVTVHRLVAHSRHIPLQHASSPA